MHKFTHFGTLNHPMHMHFCRNWVTWVNLVSYTRDKVKLLARLVSCFHRNDTTDCFDSAHASHCYVSLRDNNEHFQLIRQYSVTTVYLAIAAAAVVHLPLLNEVIVL